MTYLTQELKLAMLRNSKYAQYYPNVSTKYWQHNCNSSLDERYKNHNETWISRDLSPVVQDTQKVTLWCWVGDDIITCILIRLLARYNRQWWSFVQFRSFVMYVTWSPIDVQHCSYASLSSKITIGIPD